MLSFPIQHVPFCRRLDIFQILQHELHHPRRSKLPDYAAIHHPHLRLSVEKSCRNEIEYLRVSDGGGRLSTKADILSWTDFTKLGANPLTRFSAFSGETQDGSSLAASISKNSPSLSRTLRLHQLQISKGEDNVT